MHFAVMTEYRQSLKSLYFPGAFSSCLYAEKITGGLSIVYKSTYFFFFLEDACVSVSRDRLISVSSDSLGLQKIFHHQRLANISRFAIGFLLLDSKAQLIALLQQLCLKYYSTILEILYKNGNFLSCPLTCLGKL